MVNIQTEEIKHLKKKINPTAKHNQALQDNLGTVLPSTSEKIGRRHRIYHKVSDIQLTLAVHQDQMCTSGIDHTFNGYYYAVRERRTILCLRQGRDETTEAYYRRFEASISTA